MNDLIGQRFGRLLVIAHGYMDKHWQHYWKCSCDCGTAECLVRGAHMTSGKIDSCGCLHLKRIAAAHATHRASGTLSYGRWAAMIRRCYNKNTASYANYGGRGITVCDRWRHSYEAFVADMGECPPKHTIERVDNDKGYSPENCRWATHLEQAANKRARRSTARIEVSFNGETRSISEWAAIIGVTVTALRTRLQRLPVAQALVFENRQGRREVSDLSLNGETLSLSAWAARAGVSTATLRRRLKEMSLEEALRSGLKRRRHNTKPDE